MELLTALGFDLKIFISQLISFAILYYLLKKFALEKIISAIKSRQQEIAAGLTNAEQAAQALKQAEAKSDVVLINARTQARKIIAQAKQTAVLSRERIVSEAKTEAEKIIAAGKKQVKISQDKMLFEAKSQLADIISVGIETVTNQEISPAKIDQQYVSALLQS